MTYTEKELDQFLHGISLSLLSKKSAQHWRYDEETAKEIEWLEALERKVRADKADRKTENCSEKPNNCEHITEDGVTCAKYPACDDCLDNPLNKVKGSERLVKGKDEPTISKMEQVETMSCAECKHRPIGAEICEEPCHYEPQTDWHYDEQDATWYPYKHEDEPQTYCDNCMYLHCNYECAGEIVHKMIDDAVIAEDVYPDLRQRMHDAVDEYEPQTIAEDINRKVEMGKKEWNARHIEDEPQTEPLQTCSVNGRPYTDCCNCEYFKCTADEPQTVRSNLEPFRVDEPQTEMTTEQIVNELLSIKKILDDGKMPKQRCGNCKHLTYRWNKTWCDIKCDNPHDMVCDKWERSE